MIIPRTLEGKHRDDHCAAQNDRCPLKTPDQGCPPAPPRAACATKERPQSSHLGVHWERKHRHAPLHPGAWAGCSPGATAQPWLRVPAASWTCSPCRVPASPSSRHRLTGCFPDSTHSALLAPDIHPSQGDGCLGRRSLCLFKPLPFLLKCSKYLPGKSTSASLKSLTERSPGSGFLLPLPAPFPFAFLTHCPSLVFVSSIMAGVRPTFPP